MRRFLAALTACSVMTLAASAGANGRFPQSNHIFFSPKDPNLVLLRVTFGALVSRDRGSTWDWVCEKSVGTTGSEDPMYAIGPSGTMIATTFAGLTVSHDDACTFGFAPTLAGQVLIDLSQRPDPKDVVVFASAYDKQDDAGNILFKSQLYETTDEGATFTPLAGVIDPSILGETVDVAPSDPQRLYASGVKDPGSAPAGALLVSRDRGASWDVSILPFTTGEKSLACADPRHPQSCSPSSPSTGERSIFIAAVDPKNADRVYLRTLNAVDQPSRLIVTDDAGKTFRTVFAGKGALPAFALSADGSKVWIGGALDGVLSASTTDFKFEQKSTVPVECLALASDGLWACSSEKGGFVAGLSTDEGATFTAKLHFCDVRGPLGCPASSSTTQQCTSLWPSQRATLGCNAAPDGGGNGEEPDNSMEAGGGGCTLGAPPASPIAAAIAAVAAAIAFARRRRGTS